MLLFAARLLGFCGAEGSIVSPGFLQVLETWSKGGTLAEPGLLCGSASYLRVVLNVLLCLNRWQVHTRDRFGSAWIKQMLAKQFAQGEFWHKDRGEVTKAKPLPFKYEAGGRTLSLAAAKGETSKH